MFHGQRAQARQGRHGPANPGAPSGPARSGPHSRPGTQSHPGPARCGVAGRTWPGIRSSRREAAAEKCGRGPDLCHRSGRRPATRPHLRGRTRLLGMGDHRDSQGHRHPRRGTSRALAPQLRRIQTPQHRRDRPDAPDRSVQDRHREIAAGVTRARRGPRRDHSPGPGRQGDATAGPCLRPLRADLECADALLVPAPPRPGTPGDIPHHPAPVPPPHPGRLRAHRRLEQAAGVHASRLPKPSAPGSRRTSPPRSSDMPILEPRRDTPRSTLKTSSPIIGPSSPAGAPCVPAKSTATSPRKNGTSSCTTSSSERSLSGSAPGTLALHVSMSTAVSGARSFDLIRPRNPGCWRSATTSRPESPKPAAKAGSARPPAWRPLFKPPNRNSRPCTRSPAATTSPALACQASATPSARPAPDPRHAEQASKRTFSAETDSYGRLLLIVVTVTLRVVRISDHLMLMDFDPAVRAVSSPPFWLYWRDGAGRRRRHAPDLFARMAGGSGVVIDVRPDDRIEEKDAEAFVAMADACGLAGWGFRRAGVQDPVLTANVTWLARYRHPRCGGPPGLAGLLLEVFAGPVPLMAGAAAAGDPIAVLPALFHLMWRHELTADLAARMAAGTLVVAGAAAGGGRWPGGRAFSASGTGSGSA